MSLRSIRMQPSFAMPMKFLPWFGACLFSLVSCTTFEEPREEQPWSRFQQGSTVIGATTGWAFYQAKVKAVGQSGVLSGESGSDTATLRPNYGGGVKLHHMVTDNFALGGIVEYRSFDPESLRPLSARLIARDFETLHLILSSRYFFDDFDDRQRWRPVLGLDLSYIPEVDLGSVRVDYPSGSGLPDEHVNVVGSEFWSLSGLAGLNYQISDDVVFDIGMFYEYALTTADETVAFNHLGGASADMALRAQGLIVYVGLTYAF